MKSWLAAALLFSLAASAAGQAPSSDPQELQTPASEGAEEHEAKVVYAIPDVPKDIVHKLTSFDTKVFSLKLGLVVIGDYTAFDQNQQSLGQVGKQEDQWDLRALRFLGKGVIKFAKPWQYLIAGEYKGFDLPPDEAWGMTDLWVKIPINEAIGTVTVGKQKEPFVYEMVGDAANLPQLERILNPFFVSRNVGVRIDNTALEERLGWSFGWFNDWWTTGAKYQESGNDFATRIYGLPTYSNDGYIHVAVSGRYQGADDNFLRYRGKPESNVATYYVDTGQIPADHAWETDVEAQWVCGGFTLQGEYTHAWVLSPSTGNPQFTGWYLLGSWVITGEHRPYDKKVGYARRIIPTHRWGAPELVVRYSNLDLDDGPVQGGNLDKWFFGANWWATHHWKLGVGYGLAYLDRFGTRGRTDIWTFRLQTIY